MTRTIRIAMVLIAVVLLYNVTGFKVVIPMVFVGAALGFGLVRAKKSARERRG